MMWVRPRLVFRCCGSRGCGGWWSVVWIGRHRRFDRLRRTGRLLRRSLRHGLRGARRLPGRAEVLARVVGGHHGAFPGGEAREVPRGDLGSDRWGEARETLLAHWAEAFGIAEAAPTRVDDGAAVRLAGLVSVADWIASDGRLFSYAGAVEERAPDWPDQAVRAVVLRWRLGRWM